MTLEKINIPMVEKTPEEKKLCKIIDLIIALNELRLILLDKEKKIKSIEDEIEKNVADDEIKTLKERIERIEDCLRSKKNEYISILENSIEFLESL